MKALGQGIKVGILVVIVSVLGYIVWKSTSERAAGANGVPYWAKFRDASGLAGKSRVVIAGLTIGEIKERKLEGRYAKVTIKVKKGTEIWSNASIFKKSSSLLGESYLEIDPGTEQSVAPDGTIVANTLLPEGAQIPNVIEATSASELIGQIGETLPRVNEALDEVKGLVADVRKLVNGEIKSIASTVDNELKKDAATIGTILTRVDAVLANAEGIARDVKRVTGGADRRIDAIFDNLEAATKDAKELIAQTRQEIADTGAVARKTLDSIDVAVGKIDGAVGAFQSTFDRSASIAKKIDDDEGTLGRLVNDPTIADNVEAITTDAKQFTSTLFGLQTVIGLRTEYNFFAAAYKTYFSVEVQTRPERFYLVEVVDDPRGSITPTWQLDPTTMELQESISIDDAFRFSFQFGRRIDWLSVRVGIKESSGGIGLDASALDDQLKISLDVFDASFDSRPRIKVMLAYHFFKYLYAVAGMDDILNDQNEIAYSGAVGGITGAQPKTYFYGRDGFLGLSLSFTDADLSALLFLGGSAIGAVASGK